MIHDLDVEEILDGFVVEVVDSELLLLAEALENTREEGEGGDGVGGLEVFARFLLLGFGQLAGVDLEEAGGGQEGQPVAQKVEF